MKCRKFRNNLIFLSEKSVFPDSEKELSQHLDSCNECSELYKEISETYGNLNVEKEIEPRAFFADSVINKISESVVNAADNSSLFDKFLFNYFKKVAVSGVAVIIIMIVFFYVTEGTFLFNFLTDSDDFSIDKVSSIFFDNNNF